MIATKRPARLFLCGLVFTLVAPSLLTGCGSGRRSDTTEQATGGITGTRNTGRAVLQVAWPKQATTRLIPLATQSILVQISQNDTLIMERMLERPADTGVMTVDFDNLPVGTLRVAATAFPRRRDETPQAVGATVLETVDGKVVPFKITLKTTVIELQAKPYLSKTYVDLPLYVTLIPLDANGDWVAVSKQQFAWKVTTGKAYIDENGVVYPLAPGTLSITVTETVSGKSGSFTIPVEVQASPPPAPQW